MTVRALVQMRDQYDGRTRGTLSVKCDSVIEFGTQLQELVKDLLDTNGHHAIAVGLAAPQIGVPWRVAVVDLKTEPGKPALVLVNPRVVSASGKKDTKKESCMSVPHVRGAVERRDKVEIEFQDVTGRVQTITANGFLAHVIAHEIDHLDGILYLDRMKPGQKLEQVDFFKAP